MNVSLWLLTAATVAGGPGDAPAAVTYAAPQPRIVATTPYVVERSGPFAGLRERISTLVHGQQQSGGCAACQAQAAAQVQVAQPRTQVVSPYASPYAHSAPPPAFVTGEQQITQAQDIQTVAVSTTPAPATPAGVAIPEMQRDVRKEHRDHIGAAADYSWITGQLYYVHANGGQWVLRYAPLDQPDKFGGSVLLTTAVSMKNFREGDIVQVEGEVLDGSRTSKQLGGALYRANIVNMIDRAD